MWWIPLLVKWYCGLCAAHFAPFQLVIISTHNETLSPHGGDRRISIDKCRRLCNYTWQKIWPHPPLVSPQLTHNPYSLIDVKDETINLSDTTLTFKGKSGDKDYEVNIEFFKAVDAKDSTYKVLPRSIQMHVMKAKPEEGEDEEFWPRLLKDKALEKNQVKIDWDRYVDEDEEEEAGGFDTSALEGGMGMGGMPGMGGMGGMGGMMGGAGGGMGDLASMMQGMGGGGPGGGMDMEALMKQMGDLGGAAGGAGAGAGDDDSDDSDDDSLPDLEEN